MKRPFAFAARASLLVGFATGFLISAAVVGSTGRLSAQRPPGVIIGKASPRPCAALLAEAAQGQGALSASTGALTIDPALRTSVHAAGLERAAYDRLNSMPGEVLLKFKDGTSESARRRVLASLRDWPAIDLVSLDAALLRVFDPARAAPDVLVSTLAGHPEVAYVQPNYLRAVPRIAASDLAAPTERTTASRVRALGADGRELVVAVIDTGTARAASALSGRLWSGQAFDDVTLPVARSPALANATIVGARAIGGVTTESTDTDGHGTALATAIVGSIGQVSVMPVKVCTGYWDLMLRRGATDVDGALPEAAGGCADSDIAAGIRHAVAQGAHVIAIGIHGVWSSPAVREATADAVARGAVVVVPAGVADRLGVSGAPQLDGVIGIALTAPAPAVYLSFNPFDVRPSQTPVPRFDRYIEIAGLDPAAGVIPVVQTVMTAIAKGIAHPAAVEQAVRAALGTSRTLAFID